MEPLRLEFVERTCERVVILFGDSGVTLISVQGGRFCVTRVVRFGGPRTDLFSFLMLGPFRASLIDVDAISFRCTIAPDETGVVASSNSYCCLINKT